jgi:hypothetical protein
MKPDNIILPAVVVLYLLCLHTGKVSAQGYFKTETGISVVTAGNVTMNLNNAHFVNDGTFQQTPGSSTVQFSGSMPVSVSGAHLPVFDYMAVAKSGMAALSLQRDIHVGSKIIFISGFLDLNNHNIILLNDAELTDENETSRIMGTTGGYVEKMQTLNAPSSVNPGKLGVVITSAQNLGTTLIRRGHQSQVNSSGDGRSILRYYDIIPFNNSSLNATLRFQYFNAELNSLNESSLVLFRHDGSWSNEGFTVRDISANYIEKSGISSFSRWTASVCEAQLVPTPLITFYEDADGDGYGNAGTSVLACAAPAGYVTDNTDCNDLDPDINPGAPEVCDGMDNNCNGLVDEGGVCTTVPSITINDVMVYESEGLAVLTVTLSQPATNQVKINYKTIDGTAVSTGRLKDFRKVGNDQLTLPAGSTSGSIGIIIYPDALPEPDEYFDVLLTRATNATINDNTGRVIIRDGAPPVPRIKNMTAGNDNSDEFHVQMYPNPSHTQFKLQIQSSIQTIYDVKIVDATGRVLKQVQVAAGQTLWFGDDLKPGVYVAEIREGDKRKSIRLVKL